MSERRPLGANYRKLFGSAVAANLGDGLMSIAMVWLASAITRDALLIALVGVAGRIPWLIFSLPAGVIRQRLAWPSTRMKRCSCSPTAGAQAIMVEIIWPKPIVSPASV